MQSNDFVDSSNKYLSAIQRALDLNGNERDTLYQWVSLLLRFMSKVQFNINMDENSLNMSGTFLSDSSGLGRIQHTKSTKEELKEFKAMSKAQTHLAFLLGYTDGSFDIPPHKIRFVWIYLCFLSMFVLVFLLLYVKVIYFLKNV